MVNHCTSNALYLFGQGRGFGAEMMEIGWYSYVCHQLGINFCLQENPNPLGIAVKQGFEDYFERAFPIIESNRVALIANRNRHSSIGRTGGMLLSKIILKAIHPDFRYFAFDHQRLRNRLETALREPTQKAPYTINDHFAQIYKPNKNVSRLVLAAVNSQCLPDKYIVVHIRRGDKLQEAAYTKLASYCRAIESISLNEEYPFYIMSDSSEAIEEFKPMLSRKAVAGHSPTAAKGYSQQTFNTKMPCDRFQDTIAIMTDLEIARSSEFFIGTNTSNVFWLLRHLHRRGPTKLIDADNFL